MTDKTPRGLNLSGSNSPPLGANTFADVFGFDTPRLAAGLFIKLSCADSLLLAAGAGIGVDSGLPDFRGPQGFWRAYPGLKKSGLRFEQIANPEHFHSDPTLGWGFYGHRLKLYRETQPHGHDDGVEEFFGIHTTWPNAKHSPAACWYMRLDSLTEVNL